ncbi:hypothetical protein BU23DRAFT_59708 [Bimuria novae-zelandiae CBS 107.79]|uniref:Uncharacterized protein n=1 Tax=Bimuria novae-zelandiae CBS 107.79 TaxID=1447943 RepID=A0A6A5VFV0_9PLEO|nr:hypothetical protein BU23DRAFT_59708 [Bimuria novae-zelandiae CBS 107.79]
MRHSSPSSISSRDSTKSDDASSSVRGSSDSLSPTPVSTAPQSSNSSAKSLSHVTDGKAKTKSVKSILKTSKSTSNLAVRFSIPESPPLPVMPRLEADAPPSGGYQAEQRASLDQPARPPARMRIHKRFSASAPISRRQSQNFTAPPLPPSPTDPRIWPARSSHVGHRTSRVTSFQSVASAPAVLQSPTPLSPSDPPSQYDPLQHYVPCLALNCKNHYTASLLGPTFYSPQSPYQLIRKHGLCPMHAHQDLKLATQRVKQTYESMRQHCGRKTLGAIAAEFEIFCQQIREERAGESKRMKQWQRQRVLGSAPTSAKGKEKAWGEEWDWRYSPRPCTKKGCARAWYSPFDNRLYLFYSTARPSGLLPLCTLCPSCAKQDVESAEERVASRMRDAGGVVGSEFEEWCAQVGRDREMEGEYWEAAQERVVREKMGGVSAGVVVEQKNEVKEEKKKKKRLSRLVQMFAW